MLGQRFVPEPSSSRICRTQQDWADLSFGLLLVIRHISQTNKGSWRPQFVSSQDVWLILQLVDVCACIPPSLVPRRAHPVPMLASHTLFCWRLEPEGPFTDNRVDLFHKEVVLSQFSLACLRSNAQDTRSLYVNENGHQR